MTQVFDIGIALSAQQSFTARPHAWDGLVGFWSMLEGGGDTAFDLSGRGRNGTLDSGITWGSECINLTAASNHSVEFVGVPVTAFPFTICAWFKANDATGHYVLVGLNSSGSHFYSLDIQGDSSDRVAGVARSGGSANYTYSTTSYTVNTWNLACFCVDSATSRRVYLNGAGEGTDATSISPNAVTEFTLGDLQDIYDFDGSLGPVAIYNRALSAAEVSDMYAFGRAAYWLERQSVPIFPAAAPSAGDIPIFMHHYKMLRAS